MLQSIFVYSILGFALFLLGNIAAMRERINRFNQERNSFWNFEILLSFIIFSIFSGVRWNVGVDYPGYLNYYNALVNGYLNNIKDVEIGFQNISEILAYLNLHFSVFFGFWACLQLFFIYYAFRKEQFVLPFLGLIIVCGGQYIDWMNGMRQALAASIFVFSIQFIFQRNLLKYVITIIFASIFHQSAIILLSFYFFINIDYFKNRILTFAVLGVCIFIGLTPNWLTATQELEEILNIIGYSDYSDKLEYIIAEKQRIMAFGPRRLLNLALVGILIFYSSKLKIYYTNTRFIYFYNLTIIGALYYNLFANAGNHFLRPTYYLTIFLPISLAYLLYYLKFRSNLKISLEFLAIFMLSISYTYISIIAEYGRGKDDFVGFKFFWDYI